MLVRCDVCCWFDGETAPVVGSGNGRGAQTGQRGRAAVDARGAGRRQGNAGEEEKGERGEGRLV